MKKSLLLLLLLLVFTMPSCLEDDDWDLEPDPVPGCTDYDAINHSFLADVDDGSCIYDRVVFYTKRGDVQGIPIYQIQIAVNGSYIGDLGTVYPSNPGNCSAPGTVSFQFQSNYTADWTAAITLSNGQVFYSNGTIAPYGQECQMIPVVY